MLEAIINGFFLTTTFIGTCAWPLLILPWNDRRAAHQQTKSMLTRLELEGSPPAIVELLAHGRFAAVVRVHSAVSGGDRFAVNGRALKMRASSPLVDAALRSPAISALLAKLMERAGYVVLVEDGALGAWLPIERLTGGVIARDVEVVAADLRALAVALTKAGVGQTLEGGLSAPSGTPTPMPFGR